MNITVYGAGYVGLVSAACLSKLGHKIICVDIDSKKIELLRLGKIPFYEPELAELITENLEKGNLAFTNDYALAVQHGLIQMIAVGTPSTATGAADLTHVIAVLQKISEHIKNYRLIVIKSTVPPGTTNNLKKYVQQFKNNINFEIANNPEFLREGQAVKDFMQPDRIIIGSNSAKATELLTEIYQSIKAPLLNMDPTSAELSKYAANCILATKISFMNEMSQLAEKIGADILQVKQAIGLDPRIGEHFITPGCGYGGSCLPKDVKALAHTFKEHNLNGEILQACEKVNDVQKDILFDRLKKYFPELKNKRIAIWGLAFKPNTDDIREASSINLLKKLLPTEAIIQAYDPLAMPKIAEQFSNYQNLILCKSKEAALEQADCLVIVTEWQEFKNADLKIIKNHLKRRLIVDGRNIFSLEQLQKLDFEYYGIGRNITAKI